MNHRLAAQKVRVQDLKDELCQPHQLRDGRLCGQVLREQGVDPPMVFRSSATVGAWNDQGRIGWGFSRSSVRFRRTWHTAADRPFVPRTISLVTVRPAAFAGCWRLRAQRACMAKSAGAGT
jgi:hypothetical protein